MPLHKQATQRIDNENCIEQIKHTVNQAVGIGRFPRNPFLVAMQQSAGSVALPMEIPAEGSHAGVFNMDPEQVNYMNMHLLQRSVHAYNGDQRLKHMGIFLFVSWFCHNLCTPFSTRFKIFSCLNPL